MKGAYIISVLVSIQPLIKCPQVAPSRPYSADDNEWSYTSTPQYAFKVSRGTAICSMQYSDTSANEWPC